MSETSANRETFKFIEGTRGMAAVVVFLAHYASAFLPAFYGFSSKPHFAWEISLRQTPIWVFIHPVVAVYVFFLMSGFVLASSFLKSDLSISAQVVKRFVRLYLPVIFSVLLALCFLCVLPESKNQAAQLSGSIWLTSIGNIPREIGVATRDLLWNSMLLGYSSQSIFDRVPLASRLLLPMGEAANIPLWSLHIELWGSMLTIALAIAYRRLPRAAFWSFFVATALIVGTSQFILFLAGFAAYLGRESILRHEKVWPNIVGTALVAAGCYFSYTPSNIGFNGMLSAFNWITWAHALHAGFLRCELSAVLILLGITVSPAFRKALARPLMTRLGRVSFSFYLVHLPILLTVGCAVFLFLTPYVTYGADIALTALIGGAISLSLAALFEAHIDRRAVRLSKRMAGIRGIYAA